jgi:hypothetical protein
MPQTNQFNTAPTTSTLCGLSRRNLEAQKSTILRRQCRETFEPPDTGATARYKHYSKKKKREGGGFPLNQIPLAPKHKSNRRHHRRGERNLRGYLNAAVPLRAGQQHGPGPMPLDGDGDGNLDAEPAPRPVRRGRPVTREFRGDARGGRGVRVVGVVPRHAEEAGDPAEEAHRRWGPSRPPMVEWWECQWPAGAM